MEPYQRRLLKRAIVGVILIAVAFVARQTGLFGASNEGDRVVSVSNNTGATLLLSLMPLTESNRAATWTIAPGEKIDVADDLGEFLGLTDASSNWIERYELIGASRLQIVPGNGRSPFVIKST